VGKKSNIEKFYREGLSVKKDGDVINFEVDVSTFIDRNRYADTDLSINEVKELIVYLQGQVGSK
jgi:hypothetical protein